MKFQNVFENAFRVLICMLLGMIAYHTFYMAERLGKMEDAGRIAVEMGDCEDRCPPWVALEHSEHDKCEAQCMGATKQKFRVLLK